MGSKPIGISASRGAAILGLNQYQTMFEIWQIIMEERQPGYNSLNGYVMPEPPDCAAIRWGAAFEDAVCKLAGDLHDTIIIRKEEFFKKSVLNQQEFITCHVDGFYDAGTAPFNKIMLHEGKTTSIIPFQKKWGEPGSEKVPREYQVQCQHQMACTGAEEVILSVLVFPRTPEEFENDGIKIIPIECNQYNIEIPGQEVYEHTYEWTKFLFQMGFFHQYHIKRNQSLIEAMVDKYTEFWQKNIIEKIPPDPFNIDDIKRMAPEPKGTIVLPENIQNLYSEYKLITSELGTSGTMAKRKKQLKVMILDAARKLNPVMDDESTDKWLFYDNQGNEIGSYGKDKRGFYVFR